ncbi:hypothetical protein QTP88_006638 [Uroleucon formosanum]
MSAKTSLSTTATAKNKCAFCDRDHPLFRCLVFKRKSVTERREFVIKKELCFVCLRPDHETNSCKSGYLCKTCEGRHGVLLHLDSKHKGSGKTSAANVAAVPKPIESPVDQNLTPTNFSGAVKSDVSVLLATVIVRPTQDRSGRVEVSGLAQQPVRTVKGSTNCSFSPLLYDVPQISATNVVILPKITALMPNQKLPISIPLHTQFGWVIVGAIEGSRKYSTASSLAVHAASDDQDIGELLQRFWEVEEPDINHSPSTEDEACERHFQETPFKSIILGSMDKENTKYDAHSLGLGLSRSLALNCLYNLERRLSKDEELYNAYRDFMDEYITLGYMKLAERTGEYFIPHHAVVKRKENDIKIRVRYIFIADIVKMYRKIFVREEDRAYQHILWMRSPHEEVPEYELCTVTYGINSAPFLAIRCLLQLEQDNGPEFPLVRQFLRSSTYVDNIIAGADTREGILKVQCQVVGLLQKGCFELSVAKEDCASNPYYEPHYGQAVKILGLYWDPFEDTFGYRPKVFWAKCLMQELWCQGLNWDTPIFNEISSKWNIFIEEHPSLVHLKLLRHISNGNYIKAQLVGFADASQRGYAATVFLRVTDNQGFINVHFIACKTKVAPLKASKIDKSLTIPRLELCAALLLACLLSHKMSLLKELRTLHQEVYFHDNWFASELHLNGLNFLRQLEEQWPSQTLTGLPSEQLLEYKQPVKCVLHILKCNESEEIFRRFSSLTRMQRTLVYVWRFIDHCKQRPVSSGPLTRIELNRSLLISIKLTQDFYWEGLRKQLENTSASMTPNSFAQLSPHLDNEGLIRVGSRLRFSFLTEEAKHPVLLPKVAYITQLIIIHYHLSLLHAGPKLVMTMIQKKYWIVSDVQPHSENYTCMCAARQFKSLFNEAKTRDILMSRFPCQWYFNPPAAPHFGEIWETAIKSVKTHLRKAIGDQIMTMEEWTALIIRIEGILNSRPLTGISIGPNELCALTRGHFLIGQPFMAILEPDLMDVKMNRLTRWQLIKQAQ